MVKNRKTAYISKECVACGCCVKICPTQALTIYRGLYAVPNEKKCIGCGKCAKTCPADVIDIIAREVAAI